jgi:hypothetical protein
LRRLEHLFITDAMTGWRGNIAIWIGKIERPLSTLPRR